MIAYRVRVTDSTPNRFIGLVARIFLKEGEVFGSFPPKSIPFIRVGLRFVVVMLDW